jgi:hypothetical protein
MQHCGLKKFKISEDKPEQAGPSQHGQTALTHENALNQNDLFNYCLRLNIVRRNGEMGRKGGDGVVIVRIGSMGDMDYADHPPKP